MRMEPGALQGSELWKTRRNKAKETKIRDERSSRRTKRESILD